MTTTTSPTGAIVDLGGPDGGRYWRVVTGEPADYPDAISAAVHARVTGSVGATYNGVKVQRSLSPSDLAERTTTARKLGSALRLAFVDYDTAEGMFLDRICRDADEEQIDELMAVLDDAYDR